MCWTNIADSNAAHKLTDGSEARLSIASDQRHRDPRHRIGEADRKGWR